MLQLMLCINREDFLRRLTSGNWDTNESQNKTTYSKYGILILDLYSLCHEQPSRFLNIKFYKFIFFLLVKLVLIQKFINIYCAETNQKLSHKSPWIHHCLPYFMFNNYCLWHFLKHQNC